MRQLQLFTPTELAAMRVRAASRNHSPTAETFRRTHQRHRAWGLTQRHAERLRRSRERPPSADQHPGPPSRKPSECRRPRSERPESSLTHHPEPTPADQTAPAARSGGSDQNAPAARSRGADQTAPTARSGGADQTARSEENVPTGRDVSADRSAPAGRGASADRVAPAERSASAKVGSLPSSVDPARPSRLGNGPGPDAVRPPMAPGSRSSFWFGLAARAPPPWLRLLASPRGRV